MRRVQHTPTKSFALAGTLAAFTLLALTAVSAGCPASTHWSQQGWEPNVSKLALSEDACDQVVVEVCKAFPQCGLWKASFQRGESLASTNAPATCHKLLANGPMMRAQASLARHLVETASFATDWPKDGVFKSACNRLLDAVCGGVKDCGAFRKLFASRQREAGAEAEATCQGSLNDPEMIRSLQGAADKLASRPTPTPTP